jgi:phospholipase/carboxylesterase
MHYLGGGFRSISLEGAIFDMNRIALATNTVPVPLLSIETKEFPRLATYARRPVKRDCGPSFCTFTPIHYEAGYAYPLIVWLHSAGSSERELKQVMPLVSMRNYVAVAPAGSSAASGRPWRQSPDDIEAAAISVDHSVSQAQQQFNIHPRRVFLAGCGRAGTMALRLAWTNPQRFAGVVSINGPLPVSFEPMRRVNELRRVPCLLATSRDHRRYPANRVSSDLRLLHSAGCTVALRQYPGAHDLTDNMLADMDRWLMELICGGSDS